MQTVSMEMPLAVICRWDRPSQVHIRALRKWPQLARNVPNTTALDFLGMSVPAETVAVQTQRNDELGRLIGLFGAQVGHQSFRFIRRLPTCAEVVKFIRPMAGIE